MAPVKRIVILLAVVLMPVRASAHPIHTTLTVLTVDARSRTVTLSIRAFADDFSRVVAAQAGVATPKDSSVSTANVVAYVRARFAIDGIVLEPCGLTRSADAYLVCFRGSLPATMTAVTVRNTMLTELHPDQVNIVQASSGRERQTRVFTKTSAPVVLVRL